MVLSYIAAMGCGECHRSGHWWCIFGKNYLEMDLLAEHPVLCYRRDWYSCLPPTHSQGGISVGETKAVRLVWLNHLRRCHHKLSHTYHMGESNHSHL